MQIDCSRLPRVPICRFSQPADVYPVLAGEGGASVVSASKIPPPSFETLASGIRIVTQQIPMFNSCALNVWFDTGGADEDPDIGGISHFNEHIVFKGTQNRTCYEISMQSEEIGAALNAFTGDEYTCFHARGLGEHSLILMEILLDMVSNPRLDPADIEMEKKVVLNEISKYKDDPEARVQDLITEVMFSKHPYGRPVLGTASTVTSLNKDVLQAHLDRLYVPKNMIVSVSGNFNPDDIARVVKQFAPSNRTGIEKAPVPALEITPNIVIENKDIEQAHFVFATKGTSVYDEDRYVLALLGMALGTGMSSRFFQEIREKRGMVYTVHSGVSPLRKGGLFHVYGACDPPSNVLEAVKLIIEELDKVKREGLTERELNKARTLLRSQMVLKQESTPMIAQGNGKQYLYYGKYISPEEIEAILNSITNEKIIKVANRFFDPKYYTLAIVGPVSKLPKASDFNLGR